MSHSDDLKEYWNQRYAATPDLWGAEPNATVARLVEPLPAGRALDLGCGSGRNAVWLARRGHDVTAVDVSDVATSRARDQAEYAGVEVDVVTADLVSWTPAREAFDLVLLAYLQMPAATRRLVHRKAAAALVPGGRIVLVAHHLDNLAEGTGGPQSPDVLFVEEELAEDFGALDIEQNEKLLRPVERNGETVDAIDVVFVARKPG